MYSDSKYCGICFSRDWGLGLGVSWDFFLPKSLLNFGLLGTGVGTELFKLVFWVSVRFLRFEMTFRIEHFEMIF